MGNQTNQFMYASRISSQWLHNCLQLGYSWFVDSAWQLHVLTVFVIATAMNIPRLIFVARLSWTRCIYGLGVFMAMKASQWHEQMLCVYVYSCIMNTICNTNHSYVCQLLQLGPPPAQADQQKGCLASWCGDLQWHLAVINSWRHSFT